MGIRVKPHEIEIPESDPFQNDLLGRKEPVEILTQLIGSLEGPAVLSVDAAWGNGKTTFLKIWAKHLRNQEFPVVEFNAWETDFCGDPFLALSERITNGLEGYSGSAKKKILKTKELAKAVLRHAVPAAIRVSTAGILDITPLLEKEIGQTLAAVAKERLAAYEEAKESIVDFRASLQGMAEELWKENCPLVIMIDELDRCRPSYAVELLEVAKHLFSVDHIIFVLAVNRSELAHSVKALYGDGFDADGYLGRFFDIDFRLPQPDRKAFIADLMSSKEIDGYIERSIDHQALQSDWQPAQDLLQEFFGASGLSLRQIAQAIHHLGLVLASLGKRERSYAVTTFVALLLRTLVPEWYYWLRRGQTTDHNLIETVFGRLEVKTPRRSYAGAIFEATVVASALEISGTPEMNWLPKSSTVWDKHQKMLESEEGDAVPYLDRRYAGDIVRLIDVLKERYVREGTVGFTQSFDRIELLSAGLFRDK